MSIDAVFIKIVNMSVTASWLILVVILVRFLLKKAPKWISCVLWALVAVRLVCPFSLESVLSLVPSNETIPEELFFYEGTQQHTPAWIDVVDNPAFSQSVSLPTGQAVSVVQTRFVFWTVIWLAGMAALLLYALISYIRLKKSVGASLPVKDNILACDEVKSPFILGIIKPLIYVPSSMTGATLDYVINHETAHIKRHDHWWKPFGFLLLTVYWFNPLCWLAYVLLCRDIEMACDEKVIRDMDKGSVAAYSQALLDCSFPRRTIAACPLAFGEVGVKERVKSVLNYKKPAFWIIVTALAACIVIAICFLTDPKTPSYGSEPEWLSQFTDSIDDAVDRASLEYFHNDRADRNHSFCVTSHKRLLLADNKKQDTFTVYAWVLYQEYVPKQEGDFVVASEDGGTSVPVAITFLANDETDTIESVIEYWIPRDGGYYTKDIKNKFPEDAWDKLKDEDKFIKELRTMNLDKANAAFKEFTYTQESFDALIDEICRSPQQSSNPTDYIKAHPNEYASLLQYGELGLQYLFKEFLAGGQTGLRGHIMALACKDISNTWGEALIIDGVNPSTGQGWFDEFRDNAEALAKQYSREDLEKYYPVSFLLLQMIDNASNGQSAKGSIQVSNEADHIDNGELCVLPLAPSEYHDLTKDGSLEITEVIKDDEIIVFPQTMSTNKEQIAVTNKSDVDITAYLYVSDDGFDKAIREVIISENETKTFTGLTSRFNYRIGVSVDASAQIDLIISD